MHLAMCGHCRRYTAQIRAIGRAVHGLFTSHSEFEETTTVTRLEASILGRTATDGETPAPTSDPQSSEDE